MTLTPNSYNDREVEEVHYPSGWRVFDENHPGGSLIEIQQLSLATWRLRTPTTYCYIDREGLALYNTEHWNEYVKTKALIQERDDAH